MVLFEVTLDDLNKWKRGDISFGRQTVSIDASLLSHKKFAMFRNIELFFIFNASSPFTLPPLPTVEHLTINSYDLQPIYIPLLTPLINLKSFSLHNVSRRSPHEICLLPSFERLNLNSNALTTESICWISQLSNLTELNLSFNMIDEIPLQLCSLTKLQKLSFYHNLLSALPSTISSLTNLVELSIGKNKSLRTKEIDKLSALTNLENLSLESVSLKKVPLFLTDLTSLNYLYLNDNNKIEHVPPELSVLIGLEWLDISGNNIEMIPPCLSVLTNLTQLYIGCNANPRFNKYFDCSGHKSVNIFLKSLSKAVRWTPYPPKENKWEMIGEDNRKATKVLLCWNRYVEGDSGNEDAITSTFPFTSPSIASLPIHLVMKVLSHTLHPLLVNM